jgi:hypothetical protein
MNVAERPKTHELFRIDPLFIDRSGLVEMNEDPEEVRRFLAELEGMDEFLDTPGRNVPFPLDDEL